MWWDGAILNGTYFNLEGKKPEVVEPEEGELSELWVCVQGKTWVCCLSKQKGVGGTTGPDCAALCSGPVNTPGPPAAHQGAVRGQFSESCVLYCLDRPSFLNMHITQSKLALSPSGFFNNQCAVSELCADVVAISLTSSYIVLVVCTFWRACKSVSVPSRWALHAIVV